MVGFDLIEKTPKKMACVIGSCPATFEVEKNGEKKYLIIGKLIDPSKAELQHRVGKDEALIEVPKALIDNME